MADLQKIRLAGTQEEWAKRLNDNFGEIESRKADNTTVATAISNAVSNHNSSNSAHADLFNSKISTSEKGVANGVATLDASGQVPASQLPSYVDDVLEFDSSSVFPASGESGKIYVALDTNKTYRWGGTTYVEISKSLAIGTTAGTAFDGARGLAVETGLSSLKNQVDNFAVATEYEFTDTGVNWGALTDGVYTLTISNTSGKRPIAVYKIDGTGYAQVMATLKYDQSNIYVITDEKFSGKVIGI